MTMPTIHITAEFLRSQYVCSESVQKFEAEWPQGCTVSLETLHRCMALGLDWPSLAERCLIAPALKAYQEASASARKAYQEATAPALKAYQEASAPAWKAYEDAIALARKAYQETIALALISVLTHYGIDALRPEIARALVWHVLVAGLGQLVEVARGR